MTFKKIILSISFGSLFIGPGLKAVSQVVIPVDSLKGDNYVYAKLDDYKTHLDDIAKANKEQLDKKLQQQYNKIIVEKNTNLINDLKNKTFLFDGTIYPYLNSIFNHVLEKNGLDR